MIGRKYLFVFSSPNCPACINLKSLLNQFGISNYAEIDVENGGAELARVFGVKALPTILIIKTYEGCPPRERLKELLNE